MINIFYIIFAGLAGAYFECERLVSSGKWNLESLRIPLWKEIWGIPNSDSYHLLFGIFVTLLIFIKERYAIFKFKNLTINIIAHIILYWYLFFWIRNIGMHVLFVNNTKWWYLFPPILADLVKIII